MQQQQQEQDRDWAAALRDLQPTQRRFRAPDDFWAAALVPDIVDGDTVDLCVQLPCVDHALIYRARLLGINAPETHTRDAEEKRAGVASAGFLRALLRERRVVVNIQGADMYGRLLVHLYLPPAGQPATDDAADAWWRWLLRAVGIGLVDALYAPAPLRLRDLLHVNAHMVDAGHAVVYDGKGKRAPWTSDERRRGSS